MFNKNNNKNNFHMPVPVPLLVFFEKSENLKNDLVDQQNFIAYLMTKLLTYILSGLQRVA